MKPLVIWGASGHAKVLREFAPHLGAEVVAVFDNDTSVASPFSGVPIFYGESGFGDWRAAHPDLEAACLVAVGGDRGADRIALQEFMEAAGLTAIVAVHPAAYVAAGARVGAGSHVLAHATLCVDAVVGRGCILNTRSSVDHECVLGDGVHIAPGATLAGCVEVGDHSLIGSGAVVLPRVRIGRGVVVGAGSVVTRDLADGSVAFGNPARPKSPSKAVVHE